MLIVWWFSFNFIWNVFSSFVSKISFFQVSHNPFEDIRQSPQLLISDGITTKFYWFRFIQFGCIPQNFSSSKKTNDYFRSNSLIVPSSNLKILFFIKNSIFHWRVIIFQFRALNNPQKDPPSSWFFSWTIFHPTKFTFSEVDHFLLLIQKEYISIYW